MPASRMRPLNKARSCNVQQPVRLLLMLRRCWLRYNHWLPRSMMNKLVQKVEFVSNIAIIIVAALLSAVLIKNHLIGSSLSNKESPQREPQPVKSELIGSKIALPDVDWKESSKTIVLALSPACLYCTQSAPFYRQLAKEQSGQQGTGLIALFPEGINNGRQYLNDLGINIVDIKQASFRSIGIRGHLLCSWLMMAAQ